MITIRPATTDADIEAWIQVRRVVLPNESGGTVEAQRARESQERLLLLAELDGELAGSGLADRSDIRHRFGLAARVLPHLRRRGVGSELLRELAAHATRFEVTEASADIEDEGSQAFAERFGFREIDRQVEQVKALGDEPPPDLPEGIEVTTVAERPELLRESYELAQEGLADMATVGLVEVALKDWLLDEATLPGGSFVAFAEGEIVGYSGLLSHDNPGAAEDGLTVVRRDWRRRGLALALKQLELHWAGQNGVREVVTWTQRGNEGMRRLNERLGYEYRTVSLTMCAPLPLPLDSGRS